MKNQLVTEIVFPTFISHAYDTDLLPKIRSVFSSFDWDSVINDQYRNGYTSFFGGAETSDKLKKLMPEFCEWVVEHSHELCRRQGIDVGQRKFAVTSLWISRMFRGAAHERHLHANSVYSGTYYVNCDDSSAEIKFHDPRLYRQFMPGVWAGERMHVKPESGKLILWDSYLEHEVETNESDFVRDAISFNVDFQ